MEIKSYFGICAYRHPSETKCHFCLMCRCTIAQCGPVALFTDIGCTSKELCSQRSIYLNILRNKTASLDFLIRNKLERRNLCKTNKIYEKKGNSHSIFTLILCLLVLPFFTSSLSKIHFPVSVIKFKQYHYLYLSLNIHFQQSNKPIILKSTYLIS